MKPHLLALLAASLTFVAAQADDEKKKDDPPPAKKDLDKKEPDKKAEPAEDAKKVDPKETAERIVQNAQAAGKRLGEKDPGAETRKIQNDIIKDLDELIKQAQDPPPMDGSSGQPPPMGGMGGGGNQKQPMGGQGGGRRERKNRGGSGQQQTPGSPMPKSGDGGPMGRDSKSANNPTGGMPKSTDPRGPMPRLGDLYKDVWGHLPERLRQEMDLYYREQFMPRYQELLRQYYSSLAERKRAKGDE